MVKMNKHTAFIIVSAIISFSIILVAYFTNDAEVSNGLSLIIVLAFFIYVIGD